MDRRSGVPLLVQGAGIRWFPSDDAPPTADIESTRWIGRSALRIFAKADGMFHMLRAQHGEPNLLSILRQNGYYVWWGGKNDLVPAYAILAILFGISLHIVGYEQATSPALRGGLLAVCAIQFALLYYPIRPQIPTAADLQAGQALVQEIRAQTGDVYVPFHPDLALMAGKRTFASWSPMYQLEGNFGDRQLSLRRDFRLPRPHVQDICLSTRTESRVVRRKERLLSFV